MSNTTIKKHLFQKGKDSRRKVKPRKGTSKKAKLKKLAEEKLKEAGEMSDIEVADRVFRDVKARAMAGSPDDIKILASYVPLTKKVGRKNQKLVEISKKDLLQQINLLLRSVASGEISADEAEKYNNILVNNLNATQNESVNKRLGELEKKEGKK